MKFRIASFFSHDDPWPILPGLKFCCRPLTSSTGRAVHVRRRFASAAKDFMAIHTCQLRATFIITEAAVACAWLPSEADLRMEVLGAEARGMRLSGTRAQEERDSASSDLGGADGLGRALGNTGSCCYILRPLAANHQ